MSRIPHISEPLYDAGSQKINDNWFRYLDDLAKANVLIARGSISSLATLDIAIDGNSWDEVEIFLNALAPATDNQVLRGLVGQSGSFLTGASDYAWGVIRNDADATAAPNADQDSADSEIQITGTQGVGNAAGETVSAIVRIINPRTASVNRVITWSGHFWTAATAFRHFSGSAQLLANTDPIDDFRFLFASGSIASGYYKAIGKKL